MADQHDVEQAIDSCLTVRHLIEKLQALDDHDARVFFVTDYGDHAHTQQALPVQEIDEAETGDLVPTHYSQSQTKLVENEEEYPGKPEESFPIVILK